MRINVKKRIMTIPLLLGLIVAILVPSVGVAAQMPNFDETRSASLTVVCQDGNTPVDGMQINIYQIATARGNAEFDLTGAFSKVPIDIKHVQDDNHWAMIAEALTGYIARDNIGPSKTAKADGGRVTFTNLSTGLYLIMGDPIELDGTEYKLSPYIVALPTQDGETWNFDLVTNAKLTHEGGVMGEEEISVSATKVWDDKNNKDGKRPDRLEVTLLRKAPGSDKWEEYETVYLTADNNWSNSWEGLDSESSWKVVEADVDGYTNAGVVEKDGAYKFTNKPTGVLGGEEESKSGTSTTTRTASTGSTATRRLPQTGTTWWLVPIVAVCGVGCCIAGAVRRKHDY